MKDFEYLLDSDVKFTLIYGDRDYRCPWLGMEKLSIAANWTGAEEYRAAGYEYIHVNSTYDGGMVKQHGNLSFSRIFQAGHDGMSILPSQHHSYGVEWSAHISDRRSAVEPKHSI